MWNKSVITLISPFLICFSLISCTTTPQAPVIDRTPSTKKPASTKIQDKDWHPDTYTVKKGDTLYSIGLEFGYYYKDIAQANNILPPYVIRLGQQLKFQQLKAKESKPTEATTSNENVTESDSNVILKPLSTYGAATTTSAISGDPPLLNSPKALREPYSEQAMVAAHAQAKTATIPSKTINPEQPKTVESAKPESQKTDTTKADTPNKGEEDSIDWGWPTNGKVIAGFNESTNAKGIDIGGTQGQAINAAGSGRVIYTGSDLRGYGKLVIIKHNKNYLSVYAHNSQILVKEGQLVSKGQKIAEMGNTDADRVKLHFEIRQQGKSVDPTKFLSEK